MSIAKLTVDITSDFICPFCLLGITQLEHAIKRYTETHGPLDATLKLHPYELHSEWSVTDKPFHRNAYSAGKWGEARATSAFDSLGKQYAEVGLKLHQDPLLSSSRIAHRLTERAQETLGAAEAFAVGKALMKSYQIDGVPPNDTAALAKIAVDHKVFPTTTEAVAWLDGQDLNAEVVKLERDASARGVSGVPHMIFQGKYAVSGAQGVGAFYNLLEKVVAK